MSDSDSDSTKNDFTDHELWSLIPPVQNDQLQFMDANVIMPTFFDSPRPDLISMEDLPISFLNNVEESQEIIELTTSNNLNRTDTVVGSVNFNEGTNIANVENTDFTNINEIEPEGGGNVNQETDLSPTSSTNVYLTSKRIEGDNISCINPKFDGKPPNNFLKGMLNIICCIY